MIANIAHGFDMSPSSQQGRLDMRRGILVYVIRPNFIGI
jgi:hypothetical protein